MKKFNQVLSVVISATLAATAAPWQAYALETATMPDFVKTFTPPTRLGYVTNSFKGKSASPVILIQDLHANFGVQTKIVSLLKLFAKNSVSSNNVVVGAEGDTGSIDVSYLRQQTPKVRQLASTALLKEAEIGAPMHFAINADKNVNLVGIENAADYKLQLSLIRASVQARLKLANKIQDTRAKFAAVKAKMAPASLNKIWKAEEDYVNGEIDLDRLARVLHLPAINSYEEVEQVLLNRKLELARESKTNAVFLENMVRADHYLSLLGRLFRQQMTLEEVQFTARHMDEALSVLIGVLPNEDWSEWKETIRTAIDYYAIALMRDQPLAENAMKLVDQNPDQPVFIVTGGFHTAGIEKILASRNISYVSIAPVVESHTLKDEVLYLNRILGVRANTAQIKTDIQEKAWGNFVVEEHPNAGASPADIVRDAVVNAGGQAPTTPTTPVNPDEDKKDEIPTPFDVSDVALPAPSADVETKTLAALTNAFTAARGFVPASPTAAVEFGDTTSEGGQQWIMNVVQRNGATVVVVNRRLITLMNNIRTEALKNGKRPEQAEQRVQQALLALAVSETAVVATGSVNERTSMAARLGLFGLMGDAAVEAFHDLSLAGAGPIAQSFANGITEFMSHAQADNGLETGTANYPLVEQIANKIIDEAAGLYKGNSLFKAAIVSEPVKALFNAGLAKKVGAEAAALATQIQGSVSNALANVGISPEQNRLTKQQVDAIYGTNA